MADATHQLGLYNNRFPRLNNATETETAKLDGRIFIPPRGAHNESENDLTPVLAAALLTSPLHR